jgi:micrococcal nuclease
MGNPAPRRGGLRPLVAGHGRCSFVMNSTMRAKRGLTLPAVLALGLIVHGMLSALPAQTQRASAPPDSGLVVVVYDGDTVKVRFADGNERKVRLIGIDSPEMDDEREEVRFMAFIAKRFAFLNLYRKNVHLAYDWELEDQYGRLLAYLTTDDGALFNELILKEGFAFAYRKFPFRKDLMERFKAAETEARRAGKGLWRKESPLEVPASGARAYLGHLVSVRMTCSGFEERRSFAVLHSLAGGFEALVPKEFRTAFPGLEGLTGKTVVVSGLVEEFGGTLQILLYLPRQIVLIK